MKDFSDELYSSMSAIWSTPYVEYDQYYEPKDMGFEKWVSITQEALTCLDFKDQYLQFLEDHSFNTDKLLFMADVLWDLEVME